MRAKTILLLLIALLFTSVVSAQTRYPKREFRGAWIQCVNGQFQGMPTEKIQRLLINQLNSLQGAGINAIIFQVRAEADALYKSSYEPWSRFLTGVQGRVPSPYWDPMQFMIDECHKRGMEFHAWINPYRAKTKGTTALSPIHPYNKNPERFVNYAGQLYFDPALPENRKYICKIVRDIVTVMMWMPFIWMIISILIPTRAKIFLIMSVLRNMVADTVIKPIGAVTT